MAILMQRWGTTAKRLLLTAEQRCAFSSLPPTPAAPAPAPVLCGRGDKRTKKGKIFKGSFGNSRPKKEKKIQRIKDKLELPRTSGEKSEDRTGEEICLKGGVRSMIMIGMERKWPPFVSAKRTWMEKGELVE
ncbi:hypothetical protein E3N88_06607 [Mikania micrantha]|uniref:30S ribosomal protein S31, mitochondrial n=1 Tax=Mikania micrantha TaxID=192012 RepID=A0A5N6PPY0_9ASTR|nr:hypothetical protein E3N88_06607 [Mikania micrantha]